MTHPQSSSPLASCASPANRRCGVFMLRSATLSDAGALADIYNLYVADTTISFEEEIVTPATMHERVSKVIDGGLPWIVVEEDRIVRGYAYATPWRMRRAYRYSTETSVYVSKPHVGKGLGSLLYRDLLDRLSSCGVHVAIGGIALPNDASVALHEKLGFKKVAHFEEVGMKFGKWIDVGYWQKVVSSTMVS
jgi:L-amino acid N-acyltransferase YncA